VTPAGFAAIGVGGAAGTLLRAGLGELLPHDAGDWPWSTLIANLVGAFVLALVATRLADRVAPARHWRLLLGTGLCGGLTTFSALQLELIQLARHDETALAVLYAVVSLGLGLGLAIGGSALARRPHRG
jgi:fluoride exporter